VVLAATVAPQRRGKHASTTTEELFSMYSCQRDISGRRLELSSDVGCVPDGKDVNGQC
jgi:hypothetical protein